MQKITVLIVLIFSILSNIDAQPISFNATITDKNGKTISGLIDYKEQRKSPISILFKANGGAKKTLYPIDIQGFTIDKKSEKYVSAIVDLNTETLNESQLNEFKSMKEALAKLELVRDTVFLLTLATGEMSLYTLTDKNGKTHFFYQKGDAPIKELIYRKVKIGVEKGVKNYESIGEIKAFATQLKMDVLDCPKVFSMIKEETFYYRESDLIRIVNNYNICKGKATFIVPAKPNPIALYALAGINSVQFLSDISLGYRIDEKPISAINPVLGLGIDVGIGKKSNEFGFAFEMLYKPIRANLKSENDQSGFLNKREYDFNMSFLQLNTLFRYTIQLTDFQPYIKSGVGFAFLTNSNNSLIETKGFNNTKVTSTPELENSRLNFCLALGVKKNKLYLEGRYDLGINTSGSIYNRLKSNYLSLLLGYSFFSNKK